MGECIFPFQVKNKMTGETQGAPCGKCPNCTKRRTSAWSLRLMQEAKVSQSAHFITLTYDTKHAPITNSGFMSLDKRDVQLFFKRLRKSPGNSGSKIRYYLAGEYGGKTMRPHYHIILYNADITTISPAWEKGHIHYGTVEGASIGYTLKYISKGKTVPRHAKDDRQPEFALMSKGLGKNYLTDAMIAWHKKDLQNRMYCTIEDGKKISMPRYYKQKIYHEEQRKAIGVVARLKQLKAHNEALAANSNYYHDKAQSDQAAIRRQKIEANKLDKL